MASDLDTLRARYRALAAEVATIEFIGRGSVVQAFTTCGSPGCRCRGTPPVLHGPYWSWTGTVSGRSTSRRLTAEQARAYQGWIDNGKRLNRIIAEMEEVSRQAQEHLLPPKPTRERAEGQRPARRSRGARSKA